MLNQEYIHVSIIVDRQTHRFKVKYNNGASYSPVNSKIYNCCKVIRPSWTIQAFVKDSSLKLRKTALEKLTN